MSQLPDRIADIRIMLEILHSRKGTCGAEWFVLERWNHATYQGGTTCPFSATRGTS